VHTSQSRLKVSDEETADAHLEDLKAVLRAWGIYHATEDKFIEGKEGNIIWLDEMGQFLDYITKCLQQVVGLAGVTAKTSSGHNREQASYDGAIGGDLHLYEPHVLFAQADLTTDLAPPELRLTPRGLTSVTPKGCQVGSTLLARFQNLRDQARERGVEGDIIFVTDGHGSRFYGPLMQWLKDSQDGDETCVHGHDMFLTPPNATGNLCVLDQLFQQLHAAYRVYSLRCKSGDTDMPIGRYECQQVFADMHSQGWCSMKARAFAWKKCGLNMQVDRTLPSSIGIRYMKEASREVTLPDGSTSYACFTIGDHLKKAKKAETLAIALIDDGKAARLSMPRPSVSPCTTLACVTVSPARSPSPSAAGPLLVFPSPDPGKFAAGTESYKDEKILLLQRQLVAEKERALVSPSPNEGGVFKKHYTKKKKFLPHGGVKVPRPHGSVKTMRNGEFFAACLVTNADKAAKEEEKVVAIEKKETMYAKCATSEGCKCDGLKCDVEGWYKCPICLVIKKKKCGVAVCIEQYAKLKSQAQPLPPKPNPQGMSNKNAPTARRLKRKVGDACGPADDSDDSDDEEATAWVYDIGDEVEVYYRGNHRAWFAGTVTDRKVQSGREAYKVQHDDEEQSYTWAYLDKEEIRVKSDEPEQGMADDAVEGSECEVFSDSDDDVPLARLLNSKQ